MIRKKRQKTEQNDSAKVNRVLLKVNKAYSQFRYRGILFAQAHGKLYFE